MRQPDMLNRESVIALDPWERLAYGILRQACADYYSTCKYGDHRGYGGVPLIQNEIRSFFRSRWFAMLTDDGDGEEWMRLASTGVLSHVG